MNGYRFSIIRAAAITDPDLEPRDLQVLCLLGRHTDRTSRVFTAVNTVPVIERWWMEIQMTGRKWGHVLHTGTSNN
jgi:hypothetical protein